MTRTCAHTGCRLRRRSSGGWAGARGLPGREREDRLRQRPPWRRPGRLDDGPGRGKPRQSDRQVARRKEAFLAVLVFAAVAAPAAVGSDLRSADTQDAARAGQWGRVSDMLLPDTQDAAKAGQWGRVSDMLLPDTQDAAKAGQPASAIKMQSPDTQDAAEGVRRNGAKARCDLCEHSFVTSQGSA
jgi:hypothetical protein